MYRDIAPVIAITGSMGKTTTKEMLSSILETQWKILKTEGSQNLPVHTKRTISQLNHEHRAAVLELGMEELGAARRHGQYVKPDIAVFTCIGTAHYASLGNSIPSTARNKSLLIILFFSGNTACS